MFLVNSCLGLFSAALSGSKCKTFRLLRAILLPKLRMQFAEFLNKGFPVDLRILSPPTCVGLRYGRIQSSLEAFLGSVGFTSSSKFPLTPRHLSPFCMADFPAIRATGLDMLFQPHARVPCCVTPSLRRTAPVQEFQPVLHRLCVFASA